MIIINFKNYKTGKRALNLARTVERHLPSAIVCVSALDVKEISRKTKLKVFAQHISCFHKGRATGFIIPEFVKRDGGKGSLLNHSEHPISYEAIVRTMREAKRVGLRIVLCTSSLKQAERLKKLKPWAMAYEDKQLIGSGRSITKYKLRDVAKFVKLLNRSRIIPLCGAGVSSSDDVVASRELGCKGVLIASAVAKAKEPEKLLKEISKV